MIFQIIARFSKRKQDEFREMVKGAVDSAIRDSVQYLHVPVEEMVKFPPLKFQDVKDKRIEELEMLLDEASIPVVEGTFREWLSSYEEWYAKKERALKKADRQPLVFLTEEGYLPINTTGGKHD